MQPDLAHHSARRGLLWGALLLAALAYLLFAWNVIRPGRVILNDNGVKYLQAEYWLRSGGQSFAFPNESTRIDPQRQFAPDENTQFFYEAQGGVYSIYSDLFAALVGVSTGLMGPYGIYIVFFLLVILCGAITYGLARRLTPDYALLAPILLIVATPLVFYAVDLCEFVPMLFCTTLSIFCLWEARYGERWQLLKCLASGVLLGLAIWLRGEAYFLGPALLLAFIWQIRAIPARRLIVMILVWGAGIALLVLPLWLFQFWQTGNFLGAHYIANIDDPIRITNRLDTLIFLLPYTSKRWITTLVIVVGIRVMASFVRLERPRLVYALLAVAVIALVGLNFWREYFVQDLWRPASVLRVFPLILFLVFWPIKPAPDSDSASKRQMLSTLIVILGGFVLCLMALDPSKGGPVEWGPRLLLTIFPLLVVLIVYVIQQVMRYRPVSKWSALSAFAVLLVVTIAIQVVGLNWVLDRHVSWQDVANHFMSNDEAVVVTDITWLPHLVPELVLDRTLFLVKPEADVNALLDRLEANGVDSFLLLTALNPLVVSQDESVFQDLGTWAVADESTFVDGLDTTYVMVTYQNSPHGRPYVGLWLS